MFCVHNLWGLCRDGCVWGIVRWVVRARVVRLVRSAPDGCAQGCVCRLCAQVVRCHSYTTTATQPFEVVRVEWHNVPRSLNLRISAWHNVLKVV